MIIKDKTAEFKLQTIIDTLSMTNEERDNYCKKNGICNDNIDEWKKIILSSLNPTKEKQHAIAEEEKLNKKQQNKKQSLFKICARLNKNIPTAEITLHPKAIDYLFQHFYALRLIFSNVIGQMETDYLAIAMINRSGQLFFLSSNPAIERTMIEKNIWLYDGSFEYNFIYQNEPKLWSELYNPNYASSIYRCKQSALNIISGLSIPSDYGEYRTVFSFGFKSQYALLLVQNSNQIKKLIAMGHFCLQEITKNIPMLDKYKEFNFKPKLKLIN